MSGKLAQTEAAVRAHPTTVREPGLSRRVCPELVQPTCVISTPWERAALLAARGAWFQNGAARRRGTARYPGFLALWPTATASAPNRSWIRSSARQNKLVPLRYSGLLLSLWTLRFLRTSSMSYSVCARNW